MNTPETQIPNPPAFPVATHDSIEGHQCGHHDWQYPGMTIRDYFAAKAMQSLVELWSAEPAHYHRVAKDSYKIADAMLSERVRDGAK